MTRNHYRIILTLSLLILVLGSVGWAQAPRADQVLPPAAGDSEGLTVEVVGPSEVMVGETFDVSVRVSDIPDPGIFGYQLVLNWDDTTLTPVEDSLALSSEFGVVGQAEATAVDLQVLASRQGDVDDLTGPLTLLTWTFQANVITDPDATTLSLTNVKLGRKGGVEVPVDVVVDLDVVIVEDDGQAGDGDIVGNIKVEGRAADNQAGHAVTDGDLLSTTTDANGDFFFNNVAEGTYDFTANSPGFLKAVCSAVDHQADSLTTLLDVTLLAGDINDDMVIDITDATAIGVAFGTADAVADLNADGEVDVLDLILMAVNYGQDSDSNPWLCQSLDS